MRRVEYTARGLMPAETAERKLRGRQLAEIQALEEVQRSSRLAGFLFEAENGT